jgi:membrane-bound ClpP family serine protease
METAIIGLSVIILGWIIQLVYSWKGKKEIQRNFLILYSLGVALLIIDCYLNDLKWTGIFNTVSLMVALIVLIKISSVSKEVTKKRVLKKRR